jgi:putative ABC transport system permease protein
MDQLWADVRYAARLLARTPGVTAAIVASLALGIGANVTLFTWMEVVLWQPLPGVEDQGRLADVQVTDPHEGFLSLSAPDYRDLRDGAPRLGLIAFDDQPVSLEAGEETTRAWGLLVSGNYFDALQVKPVLGRTFREDEDQVAGRDAVVVLSHAFWQRRFGGDPSVVGRTVKINTHPFTVIGVAPPGFGGSRLALAFDAFVPLAMQPLLMPGGDRLQERGDHWLSAMACLPRGLGLRGAQAELSTVAARVARDHPKESAGLSLQLFPLWNAPRGGARILTPVLFVLSAVAGLVLLIACANIANLLLARATARRREVAVRLSLGASRARLVLQLLTESVLLALLGGAAAVLVAFWCAPLLRAFIPPNDFPIQLAPRVSGPALAFAGGLSVLTGLLFGLAPALQASRPALAGVLRDEAGSVAGRRSRLRHGLVVAQVALSVVLLVAAGLLVRSLQKAQAFHPGFEAERVLLAGLDLFSNGYDEARGTAFQARLLERVQQLPGVTAASFGRRLPLGFGGSSSFRGLRIDGYTPAADEEAWSYVNQIGPGYFRTLGVPMVEGREFEARDAADAERVIVVNQSMARKYWPGRSALGGRITLDERPHRVVGVARDFNFRRLGEEPAPFLYLALAQHYRPDAFLHVRTAGDPSLAAPAVRAAVHDLDAALPVFGMRTLRESTKPASFQQRLAGTLLGAFGALALVLAAVGLGGVLAYMVGQRTREIGVRMALGGDRRQVFALVMRQGLGLTALGLVLGLAAAAAATRPLRALLFGVSPGDPFTWLAVAGILGGAALLACALPARRAMRVDPLVALRHE